jgi:hypothetical protein
METIDNTMRTIGAIIGACIFAGLVWMWVREINNDLTIVDTKVELKDGTTYLCVEARPNRNGMTYIRKPQNTGYPSITIPTNNIKMITRFK